MSPESDQSHPESSPAANELLDVAELDPAIRVAVVIPAKNEARRIAATVRGARAIPRVDLVLVVDDGSDDHTQHVAREAGAVVVRHPHNRGKSAALETGAAVVDMRDEPDHPSRLLLFMDADLGSSATQAAALVVPVGFGEADMAIALIPPRPGAIPKGPGVALARRRIEALTGWYAYQPLSGVRCLTRKAYEAATPLAHGWGAEVGMTIDLLRQGYNVVEVPCDLRHRSSGTRTEQRSQRIAVTRDVQMAITARQLRAAGSAIVRRLKRSERPH